MSAILDGPATPYLALAAGALATYFWRGLGVALSRRLSVEQPLFQWVSAVAYAMLAGLIARLIVLPSGALASTVTTDRVAGALLAMAIFYWSRKNLGLGVFAGAGVLMLLTWGRTFLP